jgi:isocitrate dehydrogenase
MMFERYDETEAAHAAPRGLENAFRGTRITCDFARQTPDATKVSASPRGDEIISGMPA